MAQVRDGKVWLEEHVPVSYEVDVLIVGGGAAGFGAAISAARNGMNTLLVEQQGCLGGLVTLGLVNYLGSYREGVGQEFFDRLQSEGALCGQICDPEKTKLVMEQMVLESGAKILYWTYVIDAVVEGGAIKGVVAQNKSGRQTIMARVVVDCSGDGDVAAYAGAPYEVGSEEWEGYNMATSLDFRVGNVNYRKHRATPHPSMKAIQMEAVQKGDLPYLIDGGHGMGGGGYFGPLPGRPEDRAEVYVCIAHSRNCRTLDAEDLTRQVIEQRQQVHWLVNVFRKYVPGFEHCWLIEGAPMLGVRDSRRITGEYVLTGEDVVLARKFPDAVVRETHGFDIHHPTDADAGYVKHVHLPEPKEPAVCQPDGKGGWEARFKPGEYYEIPYRCLVPLKVDNLLVAGRCISTTFEAQSGTRLIMTCLNMGQAAGTAAALSVKNGVTPRELDVELLRKRLIEQGINLDREPPLYVKGGGPRKEPLPEDAEFEIGPDDALVLSRRNR